MQFISVCVFSKGNKKKYAENFLLNCLKTKPPPTTIFQVRLKRRRKKYSSVLHLARIRIRISLYSQKHLLDSCSLLLYMQNY